MTPGLVLDLISPDFKILGNPPSFDTVTRDTYPADKRLGLSRILTIAKGIAAICAHLHSKCISHGDLYAHNILVRETDGMPLLSDFGAASFYTKPLCPLLPLPLDDNDLLSQGLNSYSTPSLANIASYSASSSTHPAEGWEVQAFGHLLDELLGLADDVCNFSETECDERTSVLQSLRQLQAQCIGTIVSQRPTFVKIQSMLDRLH